MTDLAAFAPHIPTEPHPFTLRVGMGSPFTVKWTQVTDGGNVARSRTFPTRAERDAFRGALRRDTNAIHVSVQHVPGADYLPGEAPRFHVTGDAPRSMADQFADLRRTCRAFGAAVVLSLGLAGCMVTVTPPASFGEGPIPTFQQVAPPFGYVGFCVRNPGECTGGTDAPQPVELTAERWQEAVTVNAYVNALPQFAEPSGDVWRYAGTSGGDCEDLALEKRRILMSRGWPASSLLLAAVRQWNGDGHAVLVIRSTRGDFVLDNLSATVDRAADAPYRWVKMQSERRPWLWVNVDPAAARDAPVEYPAVSEPAPFLAAVYGRAAK